MDLMIWWYEILSRRSFNSPVGGSNAPVRPLTWRLLQVEEGSFRPRTMAVNVSWGELIWSDLIRSSPIRVQCGFAQIDHALLSSTWCLAWFTLLRIDAQRSWRSHYTNMETGMYQVRSTQRITPLSAQVGLLFIVILLHCFSLFFWCSCATIVFFPTSSKFSCSL